MINIGEVSKAFDSLPTSGLLPGLPGSLPGPGPQPHEPPGKGDWDKGGRDDDHGGKGKHADGHGKGHKDDDDHHGGKHAHKGDKDWDHRDKDGDHGKHGKDNDWDHGKGRDDDRDHGHGGKHARNDDDCKPDRCEPPSHNDDCKPDRCEDPCGPVAENPCDEDQCELHGVLAGLSNPTDLVDFAIGHLGQGTPGDLCQTECWDSCNDHDCVA